MTSKSMLVVAVSSLVLATSGAAFANSADCAPVDEAAAKVAFDRWAGTLPGHNPDLVLDHYAKGHSFKPHDAEAAMTDPAAIRNYWNDFVDKTPKVTLTDAKITTGCNSFVKTGVKTWTLDGAEVATNFTMEYGYEDGVWRIKRHELTPATN